MTRQTLLRLIHSVLAVGTALTIVFGVIVSATQPNYPEADNILPIFACFPYALLLFVAHTQPVRGMNVFLVGICVTAIVITLGSIYPLLEFCVLHPTVKSGGIFAKLPLLQIFAIVAGVCLSLIAMGIYKFRSGRQTTVSSIDIPNG